MAAPSLPPQRVRIIGGTWKRSPLPVAPVPGLRPTPDRVRETLFNWLLHQLEQRWHDRRVLDLYAGTGALGFEAASRGAQEAVLVEAHRSAAESLEKARARLGADTVVIHRTEASDYLRRAIRNGASFDVVFLDPPFHEGHLERILPLVLPVLAPEGLIYMESERPWDDEALASFGLVLLRKDKAGQVFYHLVRRKKTISAGEEKGVC